MDIQDGAKRRCWEAGDGNKNPMKMALLLKVTTDIWHSDKNG